MIVSQQQYPSEEDEYLRYNNIYPNPNSWDRRQQESDRYGQDSSRYGQDSDRYGQDSDRYGQDSNRYGQDSNRYGLSGRQDLPSPSASPYAPPYASPSSPPYASPSSPPYASPSSPPYAPLPPQGASRNFEVYDPVTRQRVPASERNCTAPGCCVPKCFAEKGSRVRYYFN